jgi:hypothetical protein
MQPIKIKFRSTQNINIHKMQSNILKTLTILLLSLSTLQAQEKLKIFKFDPLPLVTSALSFGIESFNEDRSRSTEFHLGIRYKKDNDNYYASPIIINNVPQDYQSDWKGLFASVERRFYVPAFKDKGANFLNQESSQSGVYFSPSLRLDFNNNDYAESVSEYVYNSDTKFDEYVQTARVGNTNYFGIMPAMNFGVQFTLFQYAYIDLHIGGGIRIQSVDENQIIGPNYSNNYNYNNNAITTFVTKEGVQPTGGITFGLKL